MTKETDIARQKHLQKLREQWFIKSQLNMVCDKIGWCKWISNKNKGGNKMKCENCRFMYNEGGYETPCYMCKFFDCYVDGDICTLEGCKPKFTELLKLERLRDIYDSREGGEDYNEYRERLIKKYDKRNRKISY